MQNSAEPSAALRYGPVLHRLRTSKELRDEGICKGHGKHTGGDRRLDS